MTKTPQASLPTKYGIFQIAVYSVEKHEQVVLTIGDVNKHPVLTRIHSECFTGDALGSRRCDCREQLEKSMEIIGKKGNGIIIYLNQEGRGIGLANKIRAYALQDQGLDTVDANISLGFAPDGRDYKIAAEILKDLGVTQINLLTNNPEKINNLTKNGIIIAQHTPLEIPSNKFNSVYLSTKKVRLGHMLKNI